MMSNKTIDPINQGFLLSRQVQDKNNRLQITLWLKTEEGPVKLLIDNELAVFFIEEQQAEVALDILCNNNIPLVKYQSLTLKTFNQISVVAFYFPSLKSFYLARELLKRQLVNGKPIKCYEDDIRPDDRFLMERFITADIDFIYDKRNPSTNSKPFYQLGNNAKCKPSKDRSSLILTMLSLDIECSLAGDLYSIGLYSHNVGEREFSCVLMIGDKPDNKTESETNVVHDYIVWVNDEKQLLIELVKQVNERDPDILIGWNVINFDFSLLQQRFDLYGLPFSIGRDGSAPYWRKNNKSDQKFIEISGRVVLDGIDLLKTATYSLPSFALDYVSNALLGQGKMMSDHAKSSKENKLKEITDNFNHDKPALAAYNLEDCRLVWLIFVKTQLLAFAQLRAQLTGLAIDRIGGSVAAFTNLYLPKLHRSGYVAPNMGDGDSELISPGGHVMDSVPGLYKNVLVLDFKSLYPSIIRTFKVDPMGLVEGLKSNQSTENNTHNLEEIKGFDGAYFSRDKHFLPAIIESLWCERDIAKQQKNAALSQAIKIIMNSFYGVLGSTGCRFFDPRLSGSITKRSHEILKTTSKWIEDKDYQVIYGDTDSIFVFVGENKSLTASKAIGIELQNFINDKWQKLLLTDYRIESHLEIEFETLFSQFFMPTIRGKDIGTKKRYAGLVADLANLTNQPKLIFKGLESVRTDWTQLAKDFQKTLYLKVFTGQAVDDYIKETVIKVRNGVFDDKLVYRKRIRRNLADYVKNVPPHVKAARLADESNKKKGKPLQYQERGWIEYYITLAGPQVIEQLSSPLDYQFYIDKQLTSVADAILPFINTSFNQITDKQLGLF